MDATRRQRWLGVAILIGILYGVVGIIFALPSNGVRVWRLAAWIVCGALYAVHIWLENFRYANRALAAASHIAAAVAVGGLVLAIAATIHRVLAVSPTPYWRFLIALIVWPMITAAPAFVVALIASLVLSRLRQAA
jgi:hypothetical protein